MSTNFKEEQDSKLYGKYLYDPGIKCADTGYTFCRVLFWSCFYVLFNFYNGGNVLILRHL